MAVLKGVRHWCLVLNVFIRYGTQRFSEGVTIK